MNILPLLMGIASGAALLLGFQLLLKKTNRVANMWLGIFMATLGMAMLEIFLAGNNFQSLYPRWFEFFSLLRFISAPALYLSIERFTSLDRKFRAVQLLHFLPFVIVFIFRISFFMTGKNIAFPPTVAAVVFFILRSALPLQSIVYWLLSLRKLSLHSKYISEISSSTEKTDLSWLKHFLLTLGVIMIAWFNLIFSGVAVVEEMTGFIYLGCTFFLSYYALRQKEVFDYTVKDLKELEALEHETNAPGKTRQKRLTDDKVQQLDLQLQHVMITYQPYLDNELTLPLLAAKLGATSNELSYLINHLYGENFYNFINRHRVEEAKQLLLSPQFATLSIIGIAYQSGFNSKTTFNNMFKKHTGMSPTAFIKQNAAEAV